MNEKSFAVATFWLVTSAALWGGPLFNVGSSGEVKAGPFDKTTVVSQTGRTLKLELKKNGSRYQGAILTPGRGKYFDLSKGAELAFDVENRSRVPSHLRIEIINVKPGSNPNAFAHVYTASIALLPYEKATQRVRYGRIGNEGIDWEPQGMQHNFDGFSKGGFKIVPSEVAQFRIWSPPLDVERTFLVSNFRLEGTPEPVPAALGSKETFYPFIDEFGQYKHAEWKGKIHSGEDLKKAKEFEDAFLERCPSIPDRTRFGGWASGPTFESRGGWSTVKYKGKWFLVDPEGKLFWSLGMNTTHDKSDSVTGITYRENYFEKLPENNAANADFYTKQHFPRYGFYKGKPGEILQFHFYCWNMFRKYGKEYHKEFVTRSQRRFSSWGFNTNGNWVHPDILKEEFHHPYISAVEFARFYDVIEGCRQIGWQKFPDVFNPGFAAGLKEALQNRQKNTVDDPFCIGYFVDNELSWGKTDTFLAEGVLRSPARQHAKAAMTEFYRKKYTDIAGLNRVWGTAYESWEDFRASAAMPADPGKAEADLAQFNDVIVNTYFSVCREMIEKYAPGKLYFGCRFNDWNVKVLQTAARYVDGMSFNRYTAEVAHFKLPDGADCPVLIGEWHFGTTVNGPAHGGLQVTASQKDRARAFDRYVRSALWNPLIIGVHYFKYTDQAATGRPADDENIQCGFVDIADTPYWEMVKAARKVSQEMYQYRIQHGPRR